MLQLNLQYNTFTKKNKCYKNVLPKSTATLAMCYRNKKMCYNRISFAIL